MKQIYFKIKTKTRDTENNEKNKTIIHTTMAKSWQQRFNCGQAGNAIEL